MSYFPLRVTAQKATQEMINNGMYGRVTIDVLSPEGMVLARMRDALLKWGQQSGKYFLSFPSKKVTVQGQEKYFDHWYLFPELQRDERDRWMDYIMGQVMAQIGNPTEPAQPAQSHQQPPQGYGPPQQQYPQQGYPQQGPPQQGYPQQQAQPPAPAPQGHPAWQPPQGPPQPAQGGYPAQAPGGPPQPPRPPQGPPQAGPGGPPPMPPAPHGGPGGPPKMPGEDTFPVPPMP